MAGRAFRAERLFLPDGHCRPVEGRALTGPQPVLLLHGWTMQGAIFDDVIARLGPGFDCHAPDLPGHGAASSQPATLDACAQAVAGHLARWPDQRPLVLGWSMGATVAWRYIAQQGSDAIGGLMTVDMSPRMRPAPDWPFGLKDQTDDSIAETTARFERDWPGATYGIAATMFATAESAPGLSRSETRDRILLQEPNRMRPLWRDMVASDERATIPRIDRPYLVSCGAQSRVYPTAATDWIVEQAPQARRHVFEDAGHSPHLETPEAFVAVVRDFARGLRG
ncbi:alpha/beta fold hydrolase [Thalassorhabdomicrobium marinisediminis]|uniref:alpha/beta fold hydrolase n=1 Tax=Thalassorhabdomicrobium marinisediminis TaxID=2170577 RepID=UPI002491B0EA|nr:alpha/beta hydrolase [Thalassorhabdomicrobium marinisediminis]